MPSQTGSKRRDRASTAPRSHLFGSNAVPIAGSMDELRCLSNALISVQYFPGALVCLLKHLFNELTVP
jgi:hypothetical protein